MKERSFRITWLGQQFSSGRSGPLNGYLLLMWFINVEHNCTQLFVVWSFFSPKYSIHNDAMILPRPNIAGMNYYAICKNNSFLIQDGSPLSTIASNINPNGRGPDITVMRALSPLSVARRGKPISRPFFSTNHGFGSDMLAFERSCFYEVHVYKSRMIMLIQMRPI